MGVHLDLDRQHLVSTRRQVQFVEQTAKTDKSTVDGFLITDPQSHLVPLAGESGMDGLKIGTKIVNLCGLLKGKVKVFGIAGAGKEKTKRRTSVEGERDHRPSPLKHAEDTSLQVFAGHIASLYGRRDCSDELS